VDLSRVDLVGDVHGQIDALIESVEEKLLTAAAAT
jgi:hypothetical protein